METMADTRWDFLLSFCFHFAYLFSYFVLYKDSQNIANAREEMWNQTKVNDDQYARGKTKHTTAVQGGFLSVCIHVITEMMKLASLVCIFISGLIIS